MQLFQINCTLIYPHFREIVAHYFKIVSSFAFMAKAVKTREIVVKRPVKYNVEHREKTVRVSVQLPQSIYEKITKDKDGNEQTVREWILNVTGKMK